MPWQQEVSQRYKWCHATLFRPVKKKLLQTTKNSHYTIWTNLTVDLMKHLPPYMSTAKVLVNQIRKNIRSNKTPYTPPTEDKPMETFETRSNHIFSNIIDPQ